MLHRLMYRKFGLIFTMERDFPSLFLDTFLCLYAQRLGQEVLVEEEYTKEEIEEELAPISVQLAFVQQVMTFCGSYTCLLSTYVLLALTCFFY